MKTRWFVPFMGGVGGLLCWALYILFTRFPMMPEQAAAQAVHVDRAWNTLLVIEGVIYALVVTFILYCLASFRARSREEQGAKIESSRGYLVEAVWLLGSAALTLALAAMGSQELRALINDPSADIDVEVRSSQFSWEFYYPKYKSYGSKLYLERGKRHRIILTSKDVVHSFWVPEFRVKQDSVPGKVIPLIITPTKVGEYVLLCNQLCGWGHTDMQGLVSVVEHEEFEKNVKEAEF